MVAFDCTLLTWAREPQHASPKAKANALAWIERSLLVGGGTGTAQEVVTALAQSRSVVVLLTDGGPNCPCGGTAPRSTAG